MANEGNIVDVPDNLFGGIPGNASGAIQSGDEDVIDQTQEQDNGEEEIDEDETSGEESGQGAEASGEESEEESEEESGEEDGVGDGAERSGEGSDEDESGEDSDSDGEDSDAEEEEGADSEDSEDNVVTALREQYQQELGIEIEGEFENNPEGLQKLNEVYVNKKAENKLLEHYQSNPAFKRFYDHVMVNGKSVDTFLLKEQVPPYLSQDIPQVNDNGDKLANDGIIAQQKEIIIVGLRAKGNTDLEIQTLIESYEDAGKLYDGAKASQEFLKQQHEQQVQAKLEAEEQQLKAQEEQLKEEYQAITQVIDSNDFQGFSIPSAELKSFKETMLNPVDEHGNTKMDYIRYQKLNGNREMRVLLDYLIYKDLDIDGLRPKDKAISKKSFNFAEKKKENTKRGKRKMGSSRDAGQSGSNPFKQISPKDFFQNVNKN